METANGSGEPELWVRGAKSSLAKQGEGTGSGREGSVETSDGRVQGTMEAIEERSRNSALEKVTLVN